MLVFAVADVAARLVQPLVDRHCRWLAHFARRSLAHRMMNSAQWIGHPFVDCLVDCLADCFADLARTEIAAIVRNSACRIDLAIDHCPIVDSANLSDFVDRFADRFAGCSAAVDRTGRPDFAAVSNIFPATLYCRGRLR